MRLSTWLTKASRTPPDVEAVERTLETGDTGYVSRRIRNRIVGRALARAGFFKLLWGPWGRRAWGGWGTCNRAAACHRHRRAQGCPDRSSMIDGRQGHKFWHGHVAREILVPSRQAWTSAEAVSSKHPQPLLRQPGSQLAGAIFRSPGSEAGGTGHRRHGPLARACVPARATS